MPDDPEHDDPTLDVQTDEEAAPGLYDPDPLEATRMREKGMGMGEEDLRLQRDPQGATTTQDFREATGTSAQDESDEDEPAGQRPSDRRH